VKGVLLAPSAIEEVVRGIPDLGTEYEVTVETVGHGERILLKVEIMPGAEERHKGIQADLLDQLRLRTNLRFDLEFHDYGTLPRYEVKAKRFRDLRKQA
jgi:phenylacetate-CoA ligase